MATKRETADDDATLLQDIAHDPLGGLARVIDRYGAALLGRLSAYAVARGHGNVDVEEVFDRVISALLDPRRRRQIIEAGGQILPWLTRLGYWRLQDADRRRQRYQTTLDENIQSPTVQSTTEEPSPKVVDVRRALDLLSPRAREILQLRYVDKLTNEQAAHRLGISFGAAKKAAHDARRRLLQILVDEGFHLNEGGESRV